MKSGSSVCMASFFKNILKRHPVVIAVLIIIIGIFAYSIEISFLDLIELKTIDLRFKARQRTALGTDVVLAVIDEKSIAREGKWIWPRSKFADLITKLSEAGAKVIAFDIGFLEPDEKSVVQAIEKIGSEIEKFEIRDERVHRYLDRLKEQTDYDKRLADAIRNSKAKIVLGYFFQMEEDVLTHMGEEEILRHQKNIKGSNYNMVRWQPGSKNVLLRVAAAPQSNIKVISEATKHAGYFNMIPDELDGVVRKIPGAIKFRDDLYAPLSLKTASAYWNTALKISVSEDGIQKMQVGTVRIPTDKFGQILVNYRGEVQSFPHIPVTDILHGDISADAIRDKIVMVGATAVGIYDMRVTPFGAVFPGLEIHANMVDNILSEDFLHQPNWAELFDIIAIIIVGLCLGIVLPRSGVITGAAAALSLFIGYILLCHFLFSRHGFILNLVYPLFVIAFVYIGIIVYRYFSEIKQKRFIKNAFSTYLSPAVVKQLIETPENLVLGGEERDITAFFSDVQGFTGIAEKLRPTELVELLNEFLTEMTDIILKNQGTVDKFEGDAIIAFFGAPTDIRNHAEIACISCIDMQKRLAQLRDKWKTEGKPELRMRIGLSTGPAVVGNMGSKNRMDYTMMGDTVNTAARLEGVNKIYGIYTLISDTTYRAAGEEVTLREIDSINVIGKSGPVSVYELIGYDEDIDRSIKETIDHYHRGLNAYRTRDWDVAMKFFNAVLEVQPEDGPSKTMLARCREFKITPPGKDWNGSFTMMSK